MPWLHNSPTLFQTTIVSCGIEICRNDAGGGVGGVNEIAVSYVDTDVTDISSVGETEDISRLEIILVHMNPVCGLGCCGSV